MIIINAGNDALLASKLTPTPTASVGATTINLAKNIVGSGVLALAVEQGRLVVGQAALHVTCRHDL